MKTVVLAILGLGLCVQARSTTLSTTDGATYANISAQRVDPDGLYIEYTLPGGGIGMSKIKFTRLSPDLQRQFGFDAGKARDYEASVAKANEDFRQEALRVSQVENAVRDERDEKAAEARMISQMQAAQPNSYGVPPGGPGYDMSSIGSGYYGGYYGGGLYGIPRTGRVPPARTQYAPIVTPIPFPRLNIPPRPNAPRSSH